MNNTVQAATMDGSVAWPLRIDMYEHCSFRNIVSRLDPHRTIDVERLNIACAIRGGVA